MNFQDQYWLRICANYLDFRNFLSIRAMKKAFKWIMVIIVITVSVVPLVAEEIRVVSYVAIPFLSEKKLEGELGHGYLIDLVVAGFNEMNVKLNIDYIPLRRCVQYFKLGKYDLYAGALPSVNALVPKENMGTVVVGYYAMGFNYFKGHHQGNIKFKKIEDLKGAKIGVRIGSAAIPMLKKAGLNLDLVPSEKGLIKMLYRKRIDFYFEADVVALFLTKKHFPNALDDLAITTKIFGGGGGIAYLIKDKNAERLAKIYEKGFDRIKKNGTYMKITRMYFGKNIPNEMLVQDMR